MEIKTNIRLAVLLFFLVGNILYVYKKEKFETGDKFMYVLGVSVLCYNGAKMLFNF